MQEARKVLIIDDDETVRSLLCAGLRLKGWIPEAVGNFGSAVAAVKSGFAIALLDPGLPDSDPVRTIQGIGRLKQLGARKVYVITGAPIDDNFCKFCSESGADGIMSKNAREFVLGLIEVFGR